MTTTTPTAETNGVDLMSTLVETTQSGTYGTPTAATAGLITTRGAASAFFINGTNRAMFRFTMINQFCNDMPALMDTTRPSDRIRQDVARSPGGDSQIFLNNCVGCHSGMDPMVQAFAYYNFDATTGAMVYTPGHGAAEVPDQRHQLPVRLRDPRRQLVEPLAHRVPNTVLGWAGRHGQRQRRQVPRPGARLERDVRAVPGAQGVPGGVLPRAAERTDLATVASLTSNFTSDGYNLKTVFQQAAAACPGS